MCLANNFFIQHYIPQEQKLMDKMADSDLIASHMQKVFKNYRKLLNKNSTDHSLAKAQPCSKSKIVRNDNEETSNDACDAGTITSSSNGSNNNNNNIGDAQFWDIIVLTTYDDRQRVSFERQLTAYQAMVPPGVVLTVVADPPNSKLGSGGSTLHVLAELTQPSGR